ncbi:hypothetical protein [Paenibacillus daejeonensis]|uniref:hypothetical protein n=1 Tax=Paenibacillus daejeonensis TaxID=135193 RepID=UPI000382084B|nr:hypothetical protein [Paenibacillus daejeonensis]
MTIIYTKKRFPPPPYDQEITDMWYYRMLYEGEHELIFPRAGQTVTTERILRRRSSSFTRRPRIEAINVTRHNPYVTVNFCSLVAEVPADLINRSLGNISADTEEGKAELEFVSAVVKASSANSKIWSAVTQHQVDGLIAYRIRRDERGKVWFEWLLGDKYLEHEDGRGADIAWVEEQGDDQNKKKFLRVERQRLDGDDLNIEQLTFLMEGDNVAEQIDTGKYAADYELEIPEDQDLPGVGELMCGLITNDATLMQPRGRSALRDIDIIQEEINWTITRDSVVFEKHGKPRLAIPRSLWNEVANQNNRHYGGRFVRSADLEVVSFDEQTGAVPQYITWDAKMEQSFEHVKRMIENLLAISKTSAQAAGLEEARGETGVALLYLWIQSVIKAESIQSKFDEALKAAIRKSMILQNALGNTDMEVSDPVIEWGDMLPKAESEADREEIEKYREGVQSLETTVRKMNKKWSEKAILAEMEKIQNDESVDSLSPTMVQPPRVRLNE